MTDVPLPRGAAPVTALAVPRPRLRDHNTDNDTLFGSKADNSSALTYNKDKRGGRSKKRSLSKESLRPSSTLPFVLSFNTVRVGMHLLGVISHVDDNFIKLSLSHGMSAKCKISEALFIENTATDYRIQLEHMKNVAKSSPVVRCVVVAIEGTNKSSSGLWVSLRPSLVNAGVQTKFLSPGEMLWGYVSSAEDHGYTIDLGIPQCRGFLDYKDSDGSDGIGHSLMVGGFIWCNKSEKQSGGDAVIKLNCVSHQLTEIGEKPEFTKQKSSINSKPAGASVAAKIASGETLRADTIKPGLLVTAEVVNANQKGLLVLFGGVFRATIRRDHLAAPAAADWQREYPKGSKIYARIIAADPVRKQFMLSSSPHLIHFQRMKFPVNIGDIVDDARIIRVDPNLGLLIGWKSASQMEAEAESSLESSFDRSGYIHISALSDEKIVDIQQSYKLGSPIRCRVIGFSFLDGQIQLTAKKSRVDSAVFRVSDLRPGAVFRAFVRESTPKGILVALGSNLHAIVPDWHLFDTAKHDQLESSNAVRHMKARLVKQHDEVRIRILRRGTNGAPAQATMKPTLVNSELPVIDSYRTASNMLSKLTEKSDSLLVHGFVSAFKNSGLIVTFFNGIHGYMHFDGSSRTMLEDYYVGQVVHVQIESVDIIRGRMKLTFADSASSSEAKPSALNVAPPTFKSDEIGSLADAELIGVVKGSGKQAWMDDGKHESIRKAHTRACALSEPYCVMQIKNGYVILPRSQLSDNIGNSYMIFDAMFAMVSETSEIAGGPNTFPVVQVSWRKISASAYQSHRSYCTDQYMPIVSAKPSVLWLQTTSQSSAQVNQPILPSHIQQLSVGQLVVGYVASVTAFALFVRSLGDLTGLAPRQWVTGVRNDDNSGLRDILPGQTVLGMVASIDDVKGSYVLDLRPRVVLSALYSHQNMENLLGESRLCPVPSDCAVSYPALDALVGLDEYHFIHNPTRPARSGCFSPGSSFRIGAIFSAKASVKDGFSCFISLPSGQKQPVQLISKSNQQEFTVQILRSQPNTGILAREVPPGYQPDFSKLYTGLRKACTVLCGIESNCSTVYIVEFEHLHSKVIGVVSLNESYVVNMTSVLAKQLTAGATIDAIVLHVPASTAKGLTFPVLSPFACLSYDQKNVARIAAKDVRPGMEVLAEVKEPFKDCAVDAAMTLRLLGVKGSYRCTVQLFDAVEVSPYDIISFDSGTKFSIPEYQTGQTISVKVVSVSIPHHRGQDVIVHASVRRDDLSTSKLELGVHRPFCAQALPKGDHYHGQILVTEPANSSTDSHTVPVNGSDRLPHLPAHSALRKEIGVRSGAVMTGVVDKVGADSIWISFGNGIRGRCAASECGNHAEEASKWLARDTLGKVVSAIVLNVSKRPVRLDVSIRLVSMCNKFAEIGSSKSHNQKKRRTSRGGAQSIHYSGFLKDLSAFVSSHQELFPGKRTIVCVRTPHSPIETLDESIRKHKSGHLKSLDSVEESAGVARLHVALGDAWQHSGYIACFESSDERGWKSFPFKQFADGMLLDAVIINAPQHAKWPQLSSLFERRRFELSLRPSVLQLSSLEAQCKPENFQNISQIVLDHLIEDESRYATTFKQGQVVRGFIVDTSGKGCFIQLSRSRTARIRLSELSNTFIVDAKESFPPGKLLEARIISRDDSTGRLELSIKSMMNSQTSHISSASLSKDATYDGVVTKIVNYGAFVNLTGVGEGQLRGLCHFSEIPGVDQRTVDAVGDVLNVGDTVCVRILGSDGSGKLSLSMRGLDQPPSHVSQSGESDRKTVETTESNFIEDDISMVSDEEDIDNEFSWQHDPANGEPTANRPREYNQADIASAEQAALDGQQQPHRSSDYERLLAASPQDSYLWLRYMAWLLGMSEIDKARDACRRALNVIRLTDHDDDKLRLWTALLNLEQEYGDEQSFNHVFEEALQVNDAKAVFLAACEILERKQLLQAALNLWNRACSQFPNNIDIWLGCSRVCMLLHNAELLRQTSQKALKLLPAKQHVNFLQQLATLEYKVGSAERGRTVFEGILASHPRRSDIFNVYVDQETAASNVDHARQLCKRAINFAWPAKKMKTVFKKYLALEQRFGNAESVANVKKLAQSYVAALVGKH